MLTKKPCHIDICTEGVQTLGNKLYFSVTAEFGCYSHSLATQRHIIEVETTLH